MGKLFTNKTILEILEKYKDVWALSHLAKLAAWDGEVYMPVQGANYRGQALAKIQTLTKKFLTDKEFIKLIEKASSENLNTHEAAVIRVLERNLAFYQKLPESFLEEFEELISKAQIVWRDARRDNDYKSFAPYLKKIVDLSREKADYLGYQKHPYDALLDIFEENSNSQKLDLYFQEVVPSAKETLEIITSSKKYPFRSKISELEYREEDAARLNHRILEFLNHDPKRLRLDKSSHPFSEGISTEDSRITTRYEESDIVRTITSTVHEFGHAIYFLQHQSELNPTPLYENHSLALHESQSRFFENHIGRTKAFLSSNLERFHNLGEKFREYDEDEFYRYFSQVNPSLIRVEADEVTYHFHIFVRYEIEKELISEELSVDDLPEKWNQMYQDTVGIKPSNDREGCLQDIHWSMGAIGYFPTYSQGTVFAAQIANTISTQLGELEVLISDQGGISKIESWLQEKLHKHGSTYTFDQIAKQVTGEEFNTNHWKKYLREKYAKLY